MAFINNWSMRYQDQNNYVNNNKNGGSDKKDVNQPKASGNSQDANLIGTSSFHTNDLEKAGIDMNKYGKYFINVYYNYYRFNAETLSQDFPGKSIKTLQDFKEAVNGVTGSVGTGSFRTEDVRAAGIKLPSDYFIGVYDGYCRFNPETIKRDFPDKHIQTLEDLKAAIDERSGADGAETTEGDYANLSIKELHEMLQNMQTQISDLEFEIQQIKMQRLVYAGMMQQARKTGDTALLSDIQEKDAKLEKRLEELENQKRELVKKYEKIKEALKEKMTPSFKIFGG